MIELLDAIVAERTMFSINIFPLYNFAIMTKLFHTKDYIKDISIRIISGFAIYLLYCFDSVEIAA